MDLDDLRSLCAIATHLSFTRAAASLHISQPALSKRLMKLEQELGVALFDRSKTHVVLTAIGNEVLTRAEETLALWERTGRLATGRSTQATAGRRRLRLGMHTPMEHSRRLVAHLEEVLPHLEITVHRAQPDRAIELLDAGELDVAALYDLPGVARTLPADAHVATLVTEPIWVLVGRVRPLADEDEVTVDQFVALGTPFHISPPGHPAHAWETAFLTASDPAVRLIEGDEFSIQAVAEGQGAGLATPQSHPTATLTLLPLVPAVTWHHYLAWQPRVVPAADAAGLRAAMHGMHVRQAQRHARYWRWMHDNPHHYPGMPSVDAQSLSQPD